MTNQASHKHFLTQPVNSVVREKIFGAAFEGELRMAASRAGVTIKLYPADVDKDGMDVLLVDENRYRPIQTKTVGPSARTKQWSTFKYFLRPNLRTASKHQFNGFPPTHQGTGLEGGIVLIKIKNLDSTVAEYLYTDFFIIYAFAEGLISKRQQTQSRRGRKSKPARELAGEILEALEQGLPSKSGVLPRVKVPSELFLRAKSSDHLLALMGLQNQHTTNWQWPWNFCLAMDNQFQIDTAGNLHTKTIQEIVRLAEAAADELLTLVDNPELKAFHT